MIFRVLALLSMMAVSCASPIANREPTTPPVAPAFEVQHREPFYPNMFRVASGYTSFNPARDLEAGEVLTLRLVGLGASQRLRLHLCGLPPCRTASTVGTWEAWQLGLGGAVEIAIETPGRYYLWIEDFSKRVHPIGEMLKAQTARWEEQTLFLDYGGGLEVIVEPVRNGRPPATATAASAALASAALASAGADLQSLLRQASRAQEKGDLAAAADLFAQADLAAGGESLAAITGLCEVEIERGRYEEATGAARRWIKLADAPAEKARGYHHLGLALVEHGLDELYPSRRALPGVQIIRPSNRILGTEMLYQAAEAFGHAAGLTGGGTGILGEVAERIRHEAYAEALEMLGDYSAAGAEGLLAEELRCRAEEGARESVERPAAPPGSSVRPPVKQHAPPARHTKSARKAGFQGVAIVQLFIDEEGRVICARSLKALPFGLEAVTIDAVKQWRFKPATLGGQPVATYYNVTHNFTLQ